MWCFLWYGLKHVTCFCCCCCFSHTPQSFNIMLINVAVMLGFFSAHSHKEKINIHDYGKRFNTASVYNTSIFGTSFCTLPFSLTMDGSASMNALPKHTYMCSCARMTVWTVHKSEWISRDLGHPGLGVKVMNFRGFTDLLVLNNTWKCVHQLA